jgi:Xaa-Pro aminopeptidase
MRSLHPVLKHGGLFTDWDMLPRDMFAARLARVQAAIAAAGDDAWLVYGDAQRYGDVAWLSHYVPRLRSVLLLVPRTGEPTILANVGSRDIPASKILTWFDDMRPFTRLPGEIVKLVRERGFAHARIGHAGMTMSMPVAEWDAIAADLAGVTWTKRDANFAELRLTKDAAEDVALRRSADAVALGLREAETAFRPGRTVRQATALVDRAIRFAGAEDVRIMVATGDRAGKPLAPPDECVLAGGDTVLLFIGAEVQRYWSEAARTLALGTPDAATTALAARAAAALEAMAAASTPGAPARGVAEAARAALGDVLFAVAAGYGFGHGIGLDAHEGPDIGSDSTGTIPADGALALHVTLHEGARGAIAGTTVLLRDGKRSTLVDPAAFPALTSLHQHTKAAS